MKNSDKEQLFQDNLRTPCKQCTSEKVSANNDVSIAFPVSSEIMPLSEFLYRPMVSDMTFLSEESQMKFGAAREPSKKVTVNLTMESFFKEELSKIKFPLQKHLAEEIGLSKTAEKVHESQSSLSNSQNISIETLPSQNHEQNSADKRELINRTVEQVVNIFSTKYPSSEHFSFQSNEIVPCEPNVADENSKHSEREKGVECALSHFVEEIELNFFRAAYDKKRNHAATVIQKVWRGFRARRQHQINAHSLINSIELRRVHDQVLKLSDDVAAVKLTLQNEHKVHLLQIQAVNCLWRKVSAMPLVRSEGMLQVQDLPGVCERLNEQIQQLVVGMQQLMRCLSPQDRCVSTQTDITVFHTESGETPSLLQTGLNSSLNTVPHEPHSLEYFVDDVLMDTVS